MFCCFLIYNWNIKSLLLVILILIWHFPTAEVSSKCFLTSLTRHSWCITQMCHNFLSLSSDREWPVKSINKGHKLAFLCGSLLFPVAVVVDSAVPTCLLAPHSVRTPLVTTHDQTHDLGCSVLGRHLDNRLIEFHIVSQTLRNDYPPIESRWQEVVDVSVVLGSFPSTFLFDPSWFQLSQLSCTLTCCHSFLMSDENWNELVL